MTKRLLAVALLAPLLALARPAAAHTNTSFSFIFGVPGFAATVGVPGPVYAPQVYAPPVYVPAPPCGPVYAPAYVPGPVYGGAVYYGPRRAYGYPAYRPYRMHYGHRYYRW